MKGPGTPAVLEELRDTLKTALHYCKSTTNPPEEVGEALLAYATVYFGVEEILELAHRSARSAQTADKDVRILRYQVEAARTACKDIRDGLKGQHGRPIRRGSQWQPRRKKTAFIFSKLSVIMDAINSTALLIAMYVIRSTA